MSSLLIIVPSFERVTEENFKRRIEEFREIVHKELEDIRKFSKKLNKDIQEAITQVFSERMDNLIQKYLDLRESYFNNAKAFNSGFKEIIYKYNSNITSTKTLIKEIEIFNHLQDFSFYRHLSKLFKDKEEVRDFAKVFRNVFTNYFQEELKELEKWFANITEEDLKNIIFSHIRESKKKVTSESTSFEEAVEIAEALITELKRLQKYLQDASSKFTIGSKEFYIYLSKLGNVNDVILTKYKENVYIKLRSMQIQEEIEQIQKEIDRKYQEYMQNLQADRKQIQNIEDKEKYKKLVKEYIALIKNINLEVYESEIKKIEEEVEEAELFRLKLLLEDIKLRYLKIKKLIVEDSVYRSELERLKSHIKEESLISRIEKVLLKKYISREDYEDIYLAFLNIQKTEQKSKEEMLSYIEKKFRQMGYTIVEQDDYGIIYLDTPIGHEYKVRIKFEGEKLTFQFVRYIDVDESELSEYEKSVDIAKVRTFCQDLSKLLEYMSDELGIIIKEDKRIEPEERIFYIKKEKAEYNLRRQKAQKDAPIKKHKDIG